MSKTFVSLKILFLCQLKSSGCVETIALKFKLKVKRKENRTYGVMTRIRLSQLVMFQNF